MEFRIPIEMPRRIHYGNNYYAVYSHKVKRMCYFFSNLELKFFNIIDITR